MNIDPAESDLTSLERDELASELLPGIKFDYQTDWEAVQVTEASTAGGHSGLSRWLLCLVLYLVFVELLMAWRFRYGIWMLFPPILLIEGGRRLLRK